MLSALGFRYDIKDWGSLIYSKHLKVGSISAKFFQMNKLAEIIYSHIIFEIVVLEGF
jgi:hypothetical protein